MFSFLFAAKFASCQTTPTEQVGRAFDSVATILRSICLFICFQATIFSVFLATWSFITLLVGPLVKLRSERFVAILGNSVLIAGFVLSAFANNTLHLAISIGLLIGPSFGLININVLLIVNTWFEKKAGLAISVMLTFNCIGKMLVPQMVKFLMIKFTVEQVTFSAMKF